MVQDSRMKISESMAKVADIIADHPALHFESRSEVLRHALREFLVDMKDKGILPPEVRL